jgi:hypothetical protein
LTVGDAVWFSIRIGNHNIILTEKRFLGRFGFKQTRFSRCKPYLKDKYIDFELMMLYTMRQILCFLFFKMLMLIQANRLEPK